jgi:4-amino-4-deoxy-L-arabinose transferase-like glycosyltransferase
MSAIMLSLKTVPPPGSEPSPWARRLSPVRVPLYWTVAAFVVCAAFAAGVAVFSTNDVHQLWGLIGACSYVAAAVAVLAWRSRGIDLALLLSVSGALITPLFMNAATGRKQPEVAVIARSAKQLVQYHSPYLGAASLAAVHNPNAYDPYLPVMALFGVPRALFGSHVVTDPRVWFGAAFVLVFWLALRAAGARNALRWTVLIAASPVVAFELAVGGTDIPILAVLCLGFALLWRHPRFVPAGIALGLASAAKATAWPAVIVAAVLIGTRDGWRPTLAFLGSALAACAAVVAPVAIVWPSALVENTILFPLGLAGIKSAAASPLPGHLIADTGHTGHLIAVGLLVLSGAVIAASLVIRPPRTVPSAVWRLAIGLTLMFLLAPATRFGYFIYPLSLVLWLEVSRFGVRQSAAPTPPGSGDPRERVAPAASPV